MPTIRVDDEVYALLQAEAKPFVDTPNTVLRRKYGLDPDAAGSTANPPTAPAGRVGKLLDVGLLNPMDELTWDRRQHGRKHVAWVTKEGSLQLDDGTIQVFATPSGAARHLAGYEVNGWRNWRHTRSGKTLDELWSELEARG